MEKKNYSRKEERFSGTIVSHSAVLLCALLASHDDDRRTPFSRTSESSAGRPGDAHNVCTRVCWSVKCEYGASGGGTKRHHSQSFFVLLQLFRFRVDSPFLIRTFLLVWVCLLHTEVCTTHTYIDFTCKTEWWWRSTKKVLISHR